MKKFFLLLAAAALLAGCASMNPKRLTPEQNSFQFVIDFPGMDKAELYQASNEWLVSAFRSAKAVIQYQDKEEGVIVGKGRDKFNVGGWGDCPTEFIVSIEAKDGKVRFTVKDFYFYEIGADPLLGPQYAQPAVSSLPHLEKWTVALKTDYTNFVAKRAPTDW